MSIDDRLHMRLGRTGLVVTVRRGLLGLASEQYLYNLVTRVCVASLAAPRRRRDSPGSSRAPGPPQRS